MKIHIVKTLVTVSFLAMTTIVVSCTGSESPSQNVKEKTQELYSDAQDEVCEMINGKLECTYKKAVRETKDFQEKMKDKASESEQ